VFRSAGNDRRSAGVLARSSVTFPAISKNHAVRPAKVAVAVPGHSNGQMATCFGQSDGGLLCHVAAPGDGRAPATGGKLPHRAMKTAVAKISFG
jgi:hypothetical protein